MEILSKLTPAETYLIKEGNRSTLKNLLKYTLVDLILKKVLKSEIRIPDTSEETPSHYISAGINYFNYQPKQHEYVFLSPYSKSSDLDILFEHLIKMGYQNASNERHFIFNLMMQSSKIVECIKNSFFKRLFVTVDLTEQGKQTRAEINTALDILEKGYTDMVNQNPDAAKEVLKKIGGNIFLLTSFEFELLAKIDQELSDQINQTRTYDSSSDDGFLGSILFFGAFSDTFDTSYDSFDSGGFDGGSGCGGDSGCSGCSGCGGCGGCGS